MAQINLETNVGRNLEALVDSNGLVDVLEALRDICDEKANHLRENWQDNVSAKEWERHASALVTAINKIR